MKIKQNKTQVYLLLIFSLALLIGIGYAARPLTAQEVNKRCGITVGSEKYGELDTCKYLMENTRYSTYSNATDGSWLETVTSSSASFD